MKITMLIVAVVLMAGCDKQEVADSAAENFTRTVMADGTPCIFYSAGHRAGLTCDWGWKERKETK